MPSPMTRRLIADAELAERVAEDRRARPAQYLPIQPVLDQCQHIQCRVREDRQDLQCQRLAHGPETRHLHTVALGWCAPKWLNMGSRANDGHTGGHTNPIHRI